MVIYMFKKICVGILMIAIICSIILQYSIDISGEEEKTVAIEKVISIDDVFKASNSEWMQVNVNGWAMINLSDVSMDNIQEIGLDAARYFELKSYDVFKNENQFMKQVNINGLDFNGDVVNIIISSEVGSGDEDETYIVVDIVSRDQARSSSHMLEKQRKFFEELGTVPFISTTITGTFFEEYDENQMESICRKVFEGVGGEIAQIMKEDGIISMAGYSPHMENAIRAGGDFINLQVAIRYSPYWGKTYIWVGNPVITTEY